MAQSNRISQELRRTDTEAAKAEAREAQRIRRMRAQREGKYRPLVVERDEYQGEDLSGRATTMGAVAGLVFCIIMAGLVFWAERMSAPNPVQQQLHLLQHEQQVIASFDEAFRQAIADELGVPIEHLDGGGAGEGLAALAEEEEESEEEEVEEEAYEVCAEGAEVDELNIWNEAHASGPYYAIRFYGTDILLLAEMAWHVGGGERRQLLAITSVLEDALWYGITVREVVEGMDVFELIGTASIQNFLDEMSLVRRALAGELTTP